MTATEHDEDIAGQQVLAELKALMRSGEMVRIEIGPTINFTEGSVVQTVQLYKRGKTRAGNVKWEKFGPLLLPPEGGDERVELLRMMADLAMP